MRIRKYSLLSLTLNIFYSMKKILATALILIFAGIFATADRSFAQPMCPDCPAWRERAPYGDYCPGFKKKWYGAKISVKTAEEAKKILLEYFSKDEVKIGLISERKWFFRAEILDKDNALTDVVIIDKRTGRIRSIY